MATKIEIPANETEAVKMGWTVDRHCYPWVAYKGPRFDPDALAVIHTPSYGTPPSTPDTSQ